MKDYIDLGKKLLALLVALLILVFVLQVVEPATRRNAGDSLVATSSVGEVSSSSAIARFATSTALVTRVIDGDTIVIEGGKSVRLLGLDADEVKEPCFDAAKDRLNDLVLNKNVVMEKELRDGDIYGRLLRFIYLDGQNIDLQIVREGLAVARTSFEGGLYADEFAAAESYARLNHIGCKWSLTLKP